jgi:adenylate cyclase
MALEIERKFLVKKGDRPSAKGTKYRQGYLNSFRERTVRVRTIGDKGYLTVKGISRGSVRLEYEYEIPVSEAAVMLDDLCEKPLIEKKRYKIEYRGLTWEVDEFFGANEGLVVAEVELEREDQEFVKPDWVGEEVTGDPKYYNANLVHYPYEKWRDEPSDQR